MESIITIDGEDAKITVHTIHPISMPMTQLATYRPITNGVRFELSNGAWIDVPHSNIACIVKEPKATRPFDPTKRPSHWDK